MTVWTANLQAGTPTLDYFINQKQASIVLEMLVTLGLFIIMTLTDVRVNEDYFLHLQRAERPFPSFSLFLVFPWRHDKSELLL